MFWKNQTPSLTIQGLHEAIHREAPGMNLSVEELEKQLTTLRDQGTISFLPRQTFKLTAAALAIEAIFTGGTWDGIKLFMGWN